MHICSGCNRCGRHDQSKMSGKMPDCKEIALTCEGCCRSGILVVGNQGVGKTTLFNLLSSKKMECSEGEGVYKGYLKTDITDTTEMLFDAPGITSLFFNGFGAIDPKEFIRSGVGRRNIKKIIFVADAKNLKRSISLALQFAEYQYPMLFVLNMVDEAESKGLFTDSPALSEFLGMQVIETVATRNIGVSGVKDAICDIQIPQARVEYTEDIESFIKNAQMLLKDTQLFPRAAALLFLSREVGITTYVKALWGEEHYQKLKEISDHYYEKYPLGPAVKIGQIVNSKADYISRQIQKVVAPSEKRFSERLGDWCTQPVTGFPIAFLVLVSMYLFIGSFGATFVVDCIYVNLFEKLLYPAISNVVAKVPWQLLRDLIIDPDFGVLSTGVFLAVGLVMPVIFCFYLVFEFFQEAGYIQRLSILFDKSFQKIGLNGKGIIPMVMGFSCVTMAILTTRVLTTEKEKNIASFLLFLVMPCSPFLAVMLILLAKLPLSATVVVFGVMISQVIISGFLLNKLLPGMVSPLLLEIPPMRIPKLTVVLKSSFSKTRDFMKEALPIFILAAVGVFFFERIGGLKGLEMMAAPFFESVLGIPEKSVQVFIKTIIRRESGAAELQHLSEIYTNRQLVVTMIVMMFIIPCINAVIVLFKERGVKVASAIIVSVMVYAVIVGSLVNHLSRLAGITFT